jgi:hypothetical protein
MKKLFRKRRRGVIAVEWIVLFPLSFMLIFFSIMYCIFVMDFLTISNASSDLAQMMNMGDSAYKEYSGGHTDYYSKSYSVIPATGDAKRQLVVSMEMKNADIHINTTATSTGEGAFDNALYDKLGAMMAEHRFNAPFTTIEEINCRTYCGVTGGTVEDTSFNTHERETESGNMVDVEVKYRFLFLKIKQHGYSFII